MAVSEKRVPRYLSIGAMAASLLFTGYLWSAGQQNPRRYVGNMAVSNHNGYGGGASCYECHVPTSAMTTSLTCVTARCHGPLLPDNTPEQATALALQTEAWQGLPDIEKRAKVFLTMHQSYQSKGQSCWECHHEHIPHAQASARGVGYESVVKEVAAEFGKAELGIGN